MPINVDLSSYRNLVNNAKTLDGDIRTEDSGELTKVNFGGAFKKVLAFGLSNRRVRAAGIEGAKSRETFFNSILQANNNETNKLTNSQLEKIAKGLGLMKNNEEKWRNGFIVVKKQKQKPSRVAK